MRSAMVCATSKKHGPKLKLDPLSCASAGQGTTMSLCRPDTAQCSCCVDSKALNVQKQLHHVKDHPWQGLHPLGSGTEFDGSITGNKHLTLQHTSTARPCQALPGLAINATAGSTGSLAAALFAGCPSTRICPSPGTVRHHRFAASCCAATR